MNAGRELDAMVAEKVMGWIGVAKRRRVGSIGDETLLLGLPKNDADTLIEVPCYSTRIRDAWEVVQALEQRGFVWYIEGGWQGTPHAQFKRWDNDEPMSLSPEAEGRATTAPLAICLAALRAVGVEEPAP